MAQNLSENHDKNLSEDYVNLKVNNNQETTEKMYKKYFLNGDFKGLKKESNTDYSKHINNSLKQMFGDIGVALNDLTIRKN